MQITQINGAGSNAWTQNVKQNHKNFSPPSFTNITTDSFSISDIGKRLSTSIRKTDETSKTDSAKMLNEPEKKMDEAMKKAQNILERIHDLSLLAQDDSIGDLDRVEIQVEIEDLRDNLVMIPGNLMKGRTESRSKWDEKFMHDRGINFGENSPFGDGSSIFDRMRMRISNGKDWNVREAYVSQETTIITHDEDGNEIWNVRAPGWYAVDDEHANIITRDSDGNFVEDTKKVPTIMETLKAWSPYVVMDSESAEETSKLLEEQIEFVKTWRGEMPDRIAVLQDNAKARDSITMEAFNFLSKAGGGLESVSLTGPSIANYHLYGSRVYNSPYSQQPFINGILVFDENGEQITPPNIEIFFQDSLKDKTEEM